jgi:hypothetical protein
MRSPTNLICLYAETEAHKYFVSKNTEYYLKYGCNLDGLVLCFIGEDTYPLCYHHHQRVIQWHQETNTNVHLSCNSVWDIKWE